MAIEIPQYRRQVGSNFTPSYRQQAKMNDFSGVTESISRLGEGVASGFQQMAEMYVKAQATKEYNDGKTNATELLTTLYNQSVGAIPVAQGVEESKQYLQQFPDAGDKYATDADGKMFVRYDAMYDNWMGQVDGVRDKVMEGMKQGMAKTAFLEWWNGQKQDFTLKVADKQLKKVQELAAASLQAKIEQDIKNLDVDALNADISDAINSGATGKDLEELEKLRQSAQKAILQSRLLNDVMAVADATMDVGAVQELLRMRAADVNNDAGILQSLFATAKVEVEYQKALLDERFKYEVQQQMDGLYSKFEQGKLTMTDIVTNQWLGYQEKEIAKNWLEQKSDDAKKVDPIREMNADARLYAVLQSAADTFTGKDKKKYKRIDYLSKLADEEAAAGNLSPERWRWWKNEVTNLQKTDISVSTKDGLQQLEKAFNDMLKAIDTKDPTKTDAQLQKVRGQLLSNEITIKNEFMERARNVQLDDAMIGQLTQNYVNQVYSTIPKEGLAKIADTVATWGPRWNEAIRWVSGGNLGTATPEEKVDKFFRGELLGVEGPEALTPQATLIPKFRQGMVNTFREYASRNGLPYSVPTDAAKAEIITVPFSDQEILPAIKATDPNGKSYYFVYTGRVWLFKGIEEKTGAEIWKVFGK